MNLSKNMKYNLSGFLASLGVIYVHMISTHVKLFNKKINWPNIPGKGKVIHSEDFRSSEDLDPSLISITNRIG